MCRREKEEKGNADEYEGEDEDSMRMKGGGGKVRKREERKRNAIPFIAIHHTRPNEYAIPHWTESRSSVHAPPDLSTVHGQKSPSRAGPPSFVERMALHKHPPGSGRSWATRAARDAAEGHMRTTTTHIASWGLAYYIVH